MNFLYGGMHNWQQMIRFFVEIQKCSVDAGIFNEICMIGALVRISQPNSVNNDYNQCLGVTSCFNDDLQFPSASS